MLPALDNSHDGDALSRLGSAQQLFQSWGDCILELLQRQVELWRKTQITDDTARLIFYTAFIDGKLEAPRSLLPEVHRLYFEPQYPEFSARTMWSLSNAFTSAFKNLDPVPQFRATAKLGGFLAQLPN
jgi:hypothetical protein